MEERVEDERGRDGSDGKGEGGRYGRDCKGEEELRMRGEGEKGVIRERGRE